MHWRDAAPKLDAALTYQALRRANERRSLAVVAAGDRTLERTTERTWWEINDRGVNFDWLDDERRAMLSAFFDGLEGRA